MRHGLSHLRVETQSKPKHEIDKRLNNMRCKKDETQNTWNKVYKRKRAKNKAEIHANSTKDGVEIHFPVGTIWTFFHHS